MLTASQLQEVLHAQRSAATASSHPHIDIDDLLDDPELEALHAERLATLKAEAEKRAILQQQGHGKLEMVEEGDFLDVVTRTKKVLCHFFHTEFERCKVMDKHLSILAQSHLETRFIKLSAPDAPFFVEKLNVRVLPCVIAFVNGVAVDRVVGFDGLGGKDDFKTDVLENILIKYGVINAQKPTAADSDDEEEVLRRRTIRQRIIKPTESDEDSDF